MEEEGNRTVGPFSFLGKKLRKKTSRTHSAKLRNLLGESLNDGNESDCSTISGISVRTCGHEVASLPFNAELGERQDQAMSNPASDISDQLIGSKEISERAINDCVHNDIAQREQQRVVNRESYGMGELTEGMRNINNPIPEDKDAPPSFYDHGQELDSREKVNENTTESLHVTDSGCVPESPGLDSLHVNKHNGTRVRRKNNLYDQIMDESAADSGLEEQGASLNHTNNNIKMNIDVFRSESQKSARDGLLDQFGERQANDNFRMRTSNASDFERKMGSTMSSRSSSMRSFSSSVPASIDSGLRMGFQEPHSSVVVVAIDFGTTFSGYAFAFTRDPDSIHMMRKWEGGDPGVNNQKTPTTLLLRPNGAFHSFGFGARDFYHDLDPAEAKRWMYFEKFKMTLHFFEVCTLHFIFIDDT